LDDVSEQQPASNRKKIKVVCEIDIRDDEIFEERV
jgi:hypothetical protein